MKRLWLKMFFVLVMANIALAVLLYWGFTWSFEIAFKRYLKEQEVERFQPFMVALVEEYKSRGDWDWVLRDHRTWQGLMRTYIILPGESELAFDAGLGLPARILDDNGQPVAGGPQGARQLPPPGQNQSLPPRPPPGSPPPGNANGGGPPTPRLQVGNFSTTTGYNPHVLLFDAEGKPVIGNTDSPEQVYYFPVMDGEEQVGTMGVRADSTLLVAMQAVIENQGDSRIVYVILGLIVLSSLIAFLLATWLTSRIFRIKAGTSALVRGQYDHRIEVSGRDALEDLAGDFNGLAQALEQNRTAHQRWIASTSHELRTPVTILQGQIDALRDGIRQVTPDYLDGLSTDIDRLNVLIDDLHQLSMSDLGALNYQKDEIELVEFLDDELTKAATLLPPELKLNWQPKNFADTYMLGDTQRLSQLVKNLIQNSVRYTDAPGEITVSIEQRHTRVKLIWEDSSPGVSAEECDRLVEPLYRAEASRSRKVGGSGLGLAIAQAIVHAHGAKMKASPSSKGGLRWEIAFPKVKHK